MTRLSPQEAVAVALEHARGTCSALEMLMLKGPLQKVIGQLYAMNSVGTGRYNSHEAAEIIIKQAVANGHNAATVRSKVQSVVASMYEAGVYAAVGIDGFYLAKGDPK